ncbi:MAG: hypothetical protein ACR2HR_14715 [Euzebya sp.]
MGSAVAQLAYRLFQALLDTSMLLGADPSRADYLTAAAGVTGGGLTLALAVTALAVVKGRPGYFAAAAGVLIFFGVLPILAYSATAGIVSAPSPTMAQLLRPPGWEYHSQLTVAFWIAGVALAAAAGDLAVRSVVAVWRTLR